MDKFFVVRYLHQTNKANAISLMDERIKFNSIVQANNKAHEAWRGCLIHVTEVKDFGITGAVRGWYGKDILVRMNEDEIEYIGKAAIDMSNNKII